jgi:hypothetical protein
MINEVQTFRIWAPPKGLKLNKKAEIFINNADKSRDLFLDISQESEIVEFNLELLKDFKSVTARIGIYNLDHPDHQEWLKYCKVECWPNYFLYHAMATAPTSPIEKSYSTEIKYLFTCMNHRPHMHRCYFMDILSKHKLLKHNRYTWHKKSDYQWSHWKQKICTLDGPFRGQQNVFPEAMYQSVFDLVTETMVKYPFITEKTYNAILFKKPFIVYGCAGLYGYLESIGYKFNRDVINFSFDKQQNSGDRAIMIAQELKRLSKYNLQELHELLRETTEHNYNLALEQLGNRSGVPPSAMQDDKYYSMIEGCAKKWK